jgi:uncharacterized protein DUF2764
VNPNSRFKYAMLMSSLPPHKRDLFATGQTPISKIQLNKRLQWLEQDDAADLAKIQSLLYWSEVSHDTDREFIAHARELLGTVNNEFFCRVITWRLELRTLIAALRHRYKGMQAPRSKNELGFGRWTLFISKNWEQDDFGIGNQLPWLSKVNSHIAADDPLALEKLLLNLVWQQYEQEGNGHYFDFEAVVIYTLRWDVINRWSSCDSDNALRRFNGIVEKCLQTNRSDNHAPDGVQSQ